MKTTVEFDVHEKDMGTFKLLTSVLKAYFKANKERRKMEDKEFAKFLKVTPLPAVSALKEIQKVTAPTAAPAPKRKGKHK